MHEPISTPAPPKAPTTPNKPMHQPPPRNPPKPPKSKSTNSQREAVKHWEIIADNLHEAGFSLGWNCKGDTPVRSEFDVEKLTAFWESLPIGTLL